MGLRREIPYAFKSSGGARTFCIGCKRPSHEPFCEDCIDPGREPVPDHRSMTFGESRSARSRNQRSVWLID